LYFVFYHLSSGEKVQAAFLSRFVVVKCLLQGQVTLSAQVTHICS
jgi:hypothetical protein